MNPFVAATVRRSSGYTVQPDGNRVPTYTEYPARVQVQALTYTDITRLDSQNIQGVRRAIYLNGAVMGIVRVAEKGGDLIVFPAGTLPEGDIWLAAHVLEAWPDWCKVAITLQNGS
ncbi:hypothetical protein [Labrys neptuniae]